MMQEIEAINVQFSYFVPSWSSYAQAEVSFVAQRWISVYTKAAFLARKPRIQRDLVTNSQ